MISSTKPITSLKQLITQENLNHIEQADFTVEDYKQILDEISSETLNNLELSNSLSPLENIKNIVLQHVNIYYSDKEISSGYYIYNKIYLNDKLPESQQIVTLIHELTHHIYAEIFEKWLGKLFNIEDYFIIGSLVMFMLNNSIENRIADEYLSYIVEGRFTPKKYQNYLPFIQLLIDLGIDVEASKDYFVFAHEISHDIDDMFKPVINVDLRENIVRQFIIDDIEPLNQELTFDYPEIRFDDAEKVEIMQEMIYFIFDYFVNGEGDIADLENYVTEFDVKIST